MTKVAEKSEISKPAARLCIRYFGSLMSQPEDERIVISRRGRPAVLVGVEGKNWEDVVLQTSPAFWKLIEERRKQPAISLKELRTRLKSRKA